MAISVESTKSRILLNINDARAKYILQRAFYKDKIWLTYTDNGFVFLDIYKKDDVLEDSNDESESEEDSQNNESSEISAISNEEIENTNEESETDDTEDSSTEEILEIPEEKIKLLEVSAGDFIDSFELTDGLYEYRYINVEEEISEKDGNKWVYSEWVRFGTPDAIGYTFGTYNSPEGKWGTAVTPDDCRYTYLWGTDFKATNGDLFTDQQVQWFIDQAVAYMERELNITIQKRTIRCNAKKRGLKKTTKWVEGDYTDDESSYDFSFRKIQRYGMIETQKRPIIEVQRCDLVYRGQNERQDLLQDCVIDYNKGRIKFLKRPWKRSQKFMGISDALEMYGNETFQPYMFYEIDYTAGYENSDEIPDDLREIIAKVAAVSLLNVIGDGLMSGFSSSSLSMDGISESFSSTQSATSAYFGARIQVYKDDIKNYITENRYKFTSLPMGCL